MLEDTEGRAYKTRRTSVTSPEHRHKESSTSPALSASTSPGSRGSSSSRGPRVPQLDIVNFPSTELLRMLAVLLQHIASSNDQLRPLHQRHQAQDSFAQTTRDMSSSMRLPLADPKRPNITTAALAALNTSNSTLCFHARHIPSISIEAYLFRILKYCPMTNDIFLSLLVYFDRLSRVGALGQFPGEGTTSAPSHASAPPSPVSTPWADKESGDHARQEAANSGGFPGISGFAIDSYNVHRLVIAGVTVASKFFSDVFYTNARYAKVGGLAVHELNQLELHFLLLTDFRLTVPMAEIQQYGNQLLAYAHDHSATHSIARPLSQAENIADSESTARPH